MYLAERLRLTLTQLRAMPNAEFVRWSMYYARKAQRIELQQLRAG